jgi:glycosyltransferase involved in cell wall biosynthesis
LGVLGEQLRREGFPVRVAPEGTRLSKVRALWRMYREDGVQVAHLHNAEATILGAAAAKWAGVGTAVSTRHGLVGRPYPVKREAQYAAASWGVDHIAAVCQKAEANIRSIPMVARNRVRTVYNGCAPARRTGERGLFRESDGWRVVQVGRLNPPKDPACLIEAAAAVRDRIERLEVVFVGDGRMRAEMEEKVRAMGLEGTVWFAGERANIGDWLDEADQFALASRSEGVPVSILEAMEAGLPVAASDVGGIAEVAPGGGLSSVVAAGDAQALGKAILEAWQQRGAKVARGEAIRRHYAERFTLESMARRYEAIYGL